ncbi:hypothetical protein M409DRAFT_19310 [Zasmidium cellare ATCC 36951]|uniref:Uncharacterized protein n=1 Tax=Zasmidium cellare ATCC 36951 TaxID=1080233 RepID=A0A6A6CXG8_ZASCE|nr:uncharacterized protein M409DRAFT_19310 [Zasmidium cellare ATCC 36951]KAF2170489.1 hypothetical protein M409DRAFT_19310 [Zasmidium cellare ATCC 36951]
MAHSDPMEMYAGFISNQLNHQHQDQMDFTESIQPGQVRHENDQHEREEHIHNSIETKEHEDEGVLEEEVTQEETSAEQPLSEAERELVAIGSALQSYNTNDGGLIIIHNQLASAFRAMTIAVDVELRNFDETEAQLQEEREKLDKKGADLEEKESKLDTLQAAIDGDREDLKAEQIKHEEARSTLANAKTDFDQERRELQAELDRLEEYDASKEDFDVRVQALEAAEANNDNQVDTVEQTLQKVVAARGKSDEEFERLRKTLLETQKELHKTQKELEQLKAENDILRPGGTLEFVNTEDRGRRIDRENRKRSRLEGSRSSSESRINSPSTLELWDHRISDVDLDRESQQVRITATSDLPVSSTQQGSGHDAQVAESSTDDKGGNLGRTPTAVTPSPFRLRTPAAQRSSRLTRTASVSLTTATPSSIQKPRKSVATPTVRRSPKWPKDEEKTKTLDEVARELKLLSGDFISPAMITVLQRGLCLFQSAANYGSLMTKAYGPKCASARASRGDSAMDSKQEHSCAYCETHGTLCIRVTNDVRTVLPRKAAIDRGYDQVPQLLLASILTTIITIADALDAERYFTIIAVTLGADQLVKTTSPSLGVLGAETCFITDVTLGADMHHC